MSLNATQTLDDASGDAVTYVLLSEDSNGSRRLDTATTLAEPGMMLVKHSVQGVNGNATDRHLVQFSRTKLTSAGVPKTAVVNFTVSVPRDTVITSTIVNDLIANLVDLISDGGFSDTGFAGTTNITAITRGES